MFFLSPVTFVIDTTIAANKTTSTTGDNRSDVKANVNAESKNKRQINQFVRIPGTNEPSSIEQSEALPLQLTHAIYGQSHSQQSVFGNRRPTPKNDQQVTEDVDEQDPEPQPQQQREVI